MKASKNVISKLAMKTVKLTETTSEKNDNVRSKKKDLMGKPLLSVREKAKRLNVNDLGDLGKCVQKSPNTIIKKLDNLTDCGLRSQSLESVIKDLVENNQSMGLSSGEVNKTVLEEREKTLRGLLSCFDQVDLVDHTLTPAKLGRIRSRLSMQLTDKLFLYLMEPNIVQSVNHLLEEVLVLRELEKTRLKKLLSQIEGFTEDVEMMILDVENILFCLNDCPDDMLVVFRDRYVSGILHLVHIDFTSSKNATIRKNKIEKMKDFWAMQQDLLFSDTFVQHFILGEVQGWFTELCPDKLHMKREKNADDWYNFCRLLPQTEKAQLSALYRFSDSVLQPLVEKIIMEDKDDFKSVDPKITELETRISKDERSSLLMMLKDSRRSLTELFEYCPETSKLVLEQMANIKLKENNKKSALRAELMVGPIDFKSDKSVLERCFSKARNLRQGDPFYRIGCYLLSNQNELKCDTYYYCDDETAIEDSEEIGFFDGHRNLLEYQGTHEIPRLIKKKMNIYDDKKYFCFMLEASDDSFKQNRVIGLDVYVSAGYNNYYSRICNKEGAVEKPDMVLRPVLKEDIDTAFDLHEKNLRELCKTSSDDIEDNSFVSKFLLVESTLVKGQKILYDKNKLKEYGRTNFALSTDHLQSSATAAGIALSRKKRRSYFNICYNAKDERSVSFVAHSHGLEQASNFTISTVYAANHLQSSTYKPLVFNTEGLNIGFLEPRTWSREDLDWWVTLGLSCVYRLFAHLEYNITCKAEYRIELEESINSMMLFQQNRQQVSEMCDMTRYVYNGLSSFEIDLFGPIEKLKNLSMYTPSQLVYCVNLVKAQFFGSIVRKIYKYSDISENVTNMCLASFPNTWIARPEADFNINYYFDSRILNKEKGFGTKISAEAKDFLGLLEEYKLYRDTVEHERLKRFGCGPRTGELIERCLQEHSLLPLLAAMRNEDKELITEVEEDFRRFYQDAFESHRFEWSFWGMVAIFCANREDFLVENIATRSAGKSRGTALGQSLYLPIGDLLSGAGSTELFEPTYERQTKRKTTTAVQMVASYLYDTILSEDTCLEYLAHWIKTFGNTSVLLGDIVSWYHEKQVAEIGVVSRTLDKDQFAGMREFSAMNFYGASLCRLTDGFFKGVCLALPQDMMLVDDKNASVEAMMKQSARARGLKFSISADCSRFGPNQTMEKMMFFIGLLVSNSSMSYRLTTNNDSSWQVILYDYLAYTPYSMLFKKVKPPYDLLATMSSFGGLERIKKKTSDSTLGKIASLALEASAINTVGQTLLPASITMPGGMYQGSLGCLSSSISTCAHMFLGKLLRKLKVCTFVEARVTNDDSFLRVVFDKNLYHMQLMRGAINQQKGENELSKFTAGTKKVKKLLAFSVRSVGQILNKKKTILSRGLGEMNSSWYEDSGSVIVPTEKLMFATLREIGTGYNPFLDSLKPTDVGLSLLQKGVSYNLATVVAAALTVMYMDQQLRWQKFHDTYNCWPVLCSGVAPIDLGLAQISKLGVIIESFRGLVDSRSREQKMVDIEGGLGNLDETVFTNNALTKAICEVLCCEMTSEESSVELENLNGVDVKVPADWVGPTATFIKKKQALRIAKELHFRESHFESLDYFPDVNSEGIGGLISLCVQQIFNKAFEQKSDSLTGNLVRGQKNNMNSNFVLRDGLLGLSVGTKKISASEIDRLSCDLTVLDTGFKQCAARVQSDAVLQKMVSKLYEVATKCSSYVNRRRTSLNGKLVSMNRWNTKNDADMVKRTFPPVVSVRVVDPVKGIEPLSIKKTVMLLDDPGILDLFFEQNGHSTDSRPLLLCTHDMSFGKAVKVTKDFQLFTMLLHRLTKSTEGKYLMFNNDALYRDVDDLVFEYTTSRRVTRVNYITKRPEQRDLSLGRSISIGKITLELDMVLDRVKKTNRLYSLNVEEETESQGLTGLYYTTDEDRRTFFQFDQIACVPFDFQIKLATNNLQDFDFKTSNIWVGTHQNAWKWFSNQYIEGKKKGSTVSFPWVVNRQKDNNGLFIWNHFIIVNSRNRGAKEIRPFKTNLSESNRKILERFSNYWNNNRPNLVNALSEVIYRHQEDVVRVVFELENNEQIVRSELVGNGTVLPMVIDRLALKFPLGVLPQEMNMLSFAEADTSFQPSRFALIIRKLRQLFYFAEDTSSLVLDEFSHLFRIKNRMVTGLVYRCAGMVGSLGLEPQINPGNYSQSTVCHVIEIFAKKYNVVELQFCNREQLSKMYAYLEETRKEEPLLFSLELLLFLEEDLLVSATTNDEYVVSTIEGRDNIAPPSASELMAQLLLDLEED